MQQIFWNLLTNAVKFTEPEGEISVEVERADEACVTVRDNGAGIAPENLPHIFDRFYQGETAAGRSGLGLGLSIAYKL